VSCRSCIWASISATASIFDEMWGIMGD
jgi:hypothetical protein